MDTVVLFLSIALFAQAVAAAVLAGSVPFLWWKALRLEAKIESIREALQKQVDTLDETLSELLATVLPEKGK